MLYKEKKDFLKRFELYKKLTLNSLRKQTRQGFDIAVKCNPKHTHIVKEEFPDIITFYQTKTTTKNKYGYYVDFVGWEHIKGLDKYKIQTSLDSDDFVSENFIKKIEDTVKGKNHSVHIHFQPTIYNIKTGEKKKMKRRYGEKGSVVYSLYNADVFIGCDSHLKMGNYAKESILIGEGYAFMGIHNNNDSSRIDM